MFGSVTKRMMNLSNPLPASSHPPANPHPPAVLRTAVHGGDSERSIGIGIRKLGKTIKNVGMTNYIFPIKTFLKSNLIEIQRIETATYSNKAYFPGEHFLYF